MYCNLQNLQGKHCGASNLHEWMLCSCSAKLPVSVVVGLMLTNDRDYDDSFFPVRLAFHQRVFFTRLVTHMFG